MVSVSDVSAFLTSLRTAKDITDVLMKQYANDLAVEKVRELSNVMIDLHKALFVFQESLDSIRKENDDLKQQLANIYDWTEQTKDYVLKDIFFGIYVYSYEPSSEGVKQQKHWLCTNCYEDRKKSVLQFKGEVMGVKNRVAFHEHNKFSCPRCKHEILVGANQFPR